ncbi:SEC10/PgrA surface exclusion domain-containing protein [Limosilactobacillus reuteri]|nr:SEC10/PgrA surface exclusion domain-containing protein [Limosilactobacillus reuteri]MCT3198213.1 SEC10/PgrA surface exclusion domain-containing protein [Limosilactobacillus reuteri]
MIYQHNKEDENKIVDFNNLSQEEAKDLAVYYATLVNQVRNAFGTDKVVVTPSSVEFTLQLIKEGYNEANWDAFGEHMTDGKNHNFQYLRNYGDNHNTTVLENMYGGLTSWGFGEDGLYKITPSNKQTMDSLKETLYEGLVGYLFDDADSGWGHANTALDLSMGHSMGKEAMAIGFDKYGYSHSEYYRLDNNNNIAADAYQLPDVSTIQEELDKVNTVLQSTKADQASKQKANDDAQNALSSANQVLVAAQNDVKDKTATAQKANDNLTTAQNDLATLQSQLSTDQANQKQAQTTFNSFDADLATKQANLQKATDSLKAEQGRLAITQADLDNANKALNDANNNLAQKKQVVENDKEALKADNDKLVQLQNNLSDLQNAPKLLAAAKEQVATAQKALADAQEVYNVANDKLTSLKQTAAGTAANVSKAQQVLAEAKNNEDAAKEALDQAQQALTELRQKEALAKQVAEEQAKLAAEKEAKDNGYHIENNQVVDAKGNSVNGWTVKGNQIVSPTNATVDPAVSVTTNVSVNSKGQVQPQTSVTTNDVKTVVATESANPVSTTTVQTREQYKQQLKSNNQLPQTGNNDSAILSLAGVALAAMLSLFGIKKREY